ncbi:MAG: hypothetical protein WC723_03125 [Candidatus Omnitrophota bacterium]
MKKTGAKIINIFFLTVFILGLFTLDSFAAQAEKPSVAGRIERPVVEYKAQGLRDPFRSPSTGGDDSRQAKQSEKPVHPGGAVEQQLPSLVVQGLIWGGDFPQAIINNKVLKIGDVIGGARVTSIDKDGVSVYFAEKQYKLSPPAANASPSKKH